MPPSWDRRVVPEPLVGFVRAVQVEGITVDSLADLSANKVTCLLSRAEPRDLVDLCFRLPGGL
jgi:predicted nucleotidyltransferase component of viral defense system